MSATAPCMSYFTTAKGEHWCSIEVGIDHAAKGYASSAQIMHEGPCVEITERWDAVENTIWAAMKSNAHFIRPAGEPTEGQIWECRDEVGRTDEQVRILASVELADDEDPTVAFIVSKAAKGYEAELGSGGSMETTEFAQRYRLISNN